MAGWQRWLGAGGQEAWPLQRSQPSTPTCVSSSSSNARDSGLSCACRSASMSAASASRWLLTEMYSPVAEGKRVARAASKWGVERSRACLARSTWPSLHAMQGQQHAFTSSVSVGSLHLQHPSRPGPSPTAMLSAPPTSPATPLRTMVWWSLRRVSAKQHKAISSSMCGQCSICCLAA